MGLLTDPSAEQGKFTKALLKYHTKLSILLYVAGIAWFCALAYPTMNATTYFSENALLPGLVKSQFREDRAAESFLEELNYEMTKYKESVPYPWLLAKMQQIGLETYTHNFTLHFPFDSGEVYTGKNVYGILRAARASSTEALVLSAPYRPSSSVHEPTAPSIALMLAFAKYASKEKFWAKDIIFLITEHEHLGVQAWLEAYHGVSCGTEGVLDSGDLDGRAGSIQAAINLEIHNSWISKVDIKIAGLNGQLPNLDLFNLAAKMCIKEGVPQTFQQQQQISLRRSPYVIWKKYFKTMMSMVLTQATGIPNGNHGLFHRFGIQALTLEGVGDGKASNKKAGFLSLGRIIEGSFRSLNNLLERFHQSYFFYLLASSDRYISIGLYMPAVCLIAAALLIKACAKWCKLQEKPEEETPESLALAKSIPVSFERLLFLSLALHTFGVFLMNSLPLWKWISTESGYPIINVIFNGFLVLLTVIMSSPLLILKNIRCLKNMTLLNIFCLLELGTVLICISMNNFSLGMICAAISTPFALLINPTNNKAYYHLQKFFWLLTHPMVVVTVAVSITTFLEFPDERLETNVGRIFVATRGAVIFSLVDSMVYGNWMFSLVTSALLPNWLLFWCVSWSFPKLPERVGKQEDKKTV